MEAYYTYYNTTHFIHLTMYNEVNSSKYLEIPLLQRTPFYQYIIPQQLSNFWSLEQLHS